MVNSTTLQRLADAASEAYTLAENEYYKVLNSGGYSANLAELCCDIGDIAYDLVIASASIEAEELRVLNNAETESKALDELAKAYPDFPACEAEKTMARKLEDANYRIRVLEEELKTSKEECNAWRAALLAVVK